MDYQTLFYPESRFGGFSDVDGTIAFAERVRALLNAEDSVLDVGCGRGAISDDPIARQHELVVLRGKVAKVVGIDVDPSASANPFIDEFHLIGENQKWPLNNQSINLCVCDSVLEHVQDPARFLSEAQRVIKPGGYLCIRTPNLFSYFGVFARLVPCKFHAAVATRVQSNRKTEDRFSTFYRCSTKWKLKRYLTRYGFDAVVYGHEAEPSYCSFSLVAYALAALHQKAAPTFIKTTLFAFAQRQCRFCLNGRASAPPAGAVFPAGPFPSPRSETDVLRGVIN